MQEAKIYRKELSFSTLAASAAKLGDDYYIAVWGGEKPHIGCTVLAAPRLSLEGNGEAACTSSVINLTGHKDEQICRYLAEEAARRCGVAAVCAGGFHTDHITKEQIEEVLAAVRELAEEMFGGRG